MPGDGQYVSVNDPINDTLHLQRRLSELGAAGGGTLDMEPGAYRLLEVAIPSNVRLRWGFGVTIVKDGGAAGTVVFRMAGAKSGVASLLTVDGAPGALTVTVADGSLFPPGRIVQISDLTYKYAATGQNLELNRVLNVAGNVLTLARPLLGTYAAVNTATVDLLNAIENAHIEGDGPIIIAAGTAGGGFLGFLADTCTVRIRVRGPSDLPGMTWKTCRASHFLFGNVRDGQTNNTQGTSYGFIFDESCHNCGAFRVDTANIRENPVTNNSRDILVSHCTDEGSFDSSFNSHGTGCERVTFLRCKSMAPKARGFIVSFAGNQASDVDITLDGPEVYDAGSDGISTQGDPGKEPKNVHIINPKIVAYGLTLANKSGLSLSSIIGGKLVGGEIDGKSGANALQGVLMNALTKFDVLGTRSRNNTWGFQQQSCTDLTVSDTWAEGNSSLNYRSVIAGTRIKWLRVRGDNTNFTFLATDEADLDILRAVSADRGDASVTLTAWIQEGTQQFATALTANRTVTLATPAFKGAKFRVTRTGLGAFTLDVGGLKTIPAGTAAFVDVAYDGANWKLTGYGTL